MTFSFSITLIFLIFMIFWIQVPGMLLQELLLPRYFKFSTRLLAGFFFGYVLLAALYLIESLTTISGIIAVAGPMVSVIAIYMYLKNDKPSVYNAREHFKWNGIIIFGFIYLASALNFQFKYIGALDGQTIQVYHDYLFHTGNIASLSRSFPNMDIRVSGLTFYYHYFYELTFAMCKHIFHMDAFRLYLNGNALLTAWPVTLGLLTIGERLRAGKICHKRNCFFYSAGTLVSCIAIFPINVWGGHLPLSWMDNHIFGNANALGMAIALSVLVVDVLVEIWYDKFDSKLLIALFLLAVATTGFKGTTGALLVGISWAVFIVEMLITKKFHSSRLFYVLSLTVGFILTYFLVTVGLHSAGANNRATELTPAGTIENGRVGQLFNIVGLDATAFPWVIIAIVLCMVLIMGPLVLAFGAFTIDKFKTLIKEGVIGDIFDWFTIGIVMMGLIGFVAFKVPGNSQSYFVIGNACFIFYGAMKYIIAHRKSVIAYISYLFFGVGTAFLLIDLAYYAHEDVKQQAIFTQPANDRADLVSKDTLEAYLWLRDNTPEDSILAVDRFSEEIDYRSIYFYCSAFSERQCYLEGYDYSDITAKQVDAMKAINEKFYSNNAFEAETAMDMSGVDYLVVTKMGHPNYICECPKLKLVFENDEVSIYSYESEVEVSSGKK